MADSACCPQSCERDESHESDTESQEGRILRSRDSGQNENENRRKAITRAARMRQYRQNIKDDEEAYIEHRAAETYRVKKFRMNMSEETKARYKEKSKMRMKLYRARKKAQMENTGKGPAKTRKGLDERRQKWREQKRQQRARMSQQKKRWVNERRREKYRKSRHQVGAEHTEKEDNNTENEETEVYISDHDDSESTSSIHDDSRPTYTPTAKAKAISRAISVLPKDPKKYTEVVAGIIGKSSPRKRKRIIDNSGLMAKKSKFMNDTMKNLKSTLQRIKKKRDKKSIHTRRIISSSIGIRNKSHAHYELGFSWTYLSKCSQLEIDSRQQRSDAVSITTIEVVEKFYKRADISRILPDTKYIKKKSMQSQHVMECSLKRAFEKFKEENPGINISFSVFVKLRPNNIKTMSHNKLIQCCCEYCVNVELKVWALNKFALQKKVKLCLRDKYEASRVTLCPKTDKYYQKLCVDRKCQKCGVTKLTQKLEPLKQFGNTHITWGKWENVTTDRNGSTVTRKALVSKTAPLKSLIDELKVEISSFSKHIFVAQWQISQYDMLKDNIPDKCCLAIIDFGENYTCHYQDEAQSAHWAYNQVTLHPIVCFFPCTNAGCSEICRFSIVVVSNDLKHDSHAVHSYLSKAVKFLQREKVSIKKLIIFSDGAPTQYKNKCSFCDCSFGSKDFKIKVERHYYGSRHGKGPCDAEVGVIKRCVSLAVNARQVVIGNAEDLFHYCVSNLTTLPGHRHSKRSFIFVSSENINRTRPDRNNIQTVKNTRSTHAVVGVKPYVVQMTELSCFCKNCRDGKDFCVNKDHTGKAVKVVIKRSQSTAAERENAELQVEDDRNTSIDGTSEAQPSCSNSTSVDGTSEAQPSCSNSTSVDGTSEAQPMSRRSSKILQTRSKRSIRSTRSPEIAIAGCSDSAVETSSTFSQLQKDIFVLVKLTTNKGKSGTFYVVQVEDTPEKHCPINVQYLEQPYKRKPGLWRFGDLEEHYSVQMTDIVKILKPPELLTHRTGATYYFFPELE